MINFDEVRGSLVVSRRGFSDRIKMLCRTLLLVLVVTFIWLPSQSSFAAVPQLASGSVFAQVRGNQDTIKPPSPEEKRSEAIKECLPLELASVDNDFGERVERALGKTGSAQIDRTFGLTNDPKLSEAEKEFERCLERKGALPERQLAQ